MQRKANKVQYSTILIQSSRCRLTPLFFPIVGGYITSYLKNLRTSTKPEKELLKQYYGDIRTNKKFPFDIRQYSQNYQFSQLFSALNLGYSAEADIIFSSQSYVPRSSSFSLNSYLFGNAFNLLEVSNPTFSSKPNFSQPISHGYRPQVDARIENLEYLIEKFSGPRSYLKTTDAEDMADDLVDTVQSFAGQMAQKVASLSRSKRATKQQTKIKQTVKFSCVFFLHYSPNFSSFRLRFPLQPFFCIFPSFFHHFSLHFATAHFKFRQENFFMSHLIL